MLSNICKAKVEKVKTITRIVGFILIETFGYSQNTY